MLRNYIRKRKKNTTHLETNKASTFNEDEKEEKRSQYQSKQRISGMRLKWCRENRIIKTWKHPLAVVTKKSQEGFWGRKAA